MNDTQNPGSAEPDAPDNRSENNDPLSGKGSATGDTASGEPPKVEPESSQRKNGLRNSLLLLGVIALIAAAGGFYWIQQKDRADDLEQAINSLGDEVQQQAAEMGRLETQLEALRAESGRANSATSQLTSSIGRQGRQIEELPLRIGRLERAVDNLPNIENGARRSWALAEAAYYMQIANAQASLVGNTDGALKALLLADATLRDLADPALAPVRATLSDEITQLRGTPGMDTEGVVLTLQSMVRQLPELPLKNTVPDSFGRDSDIANDEDSGMARAARVIREAFSSIVSIKPSEQTSTPLLSAEENQLLIQNLGLEIKLAQLALLRNEPRAYRQALSNVRASLVGYFDTGAARVQATISTIDNLRSADFSPETPDVSGSLTLLRQLGGEAALP